MTTQAERCHGRGGHCTAPPTHYVILPGRPKVPMCELDGEHLVTVLQGGFGVDAVLEPIAAEIADDD